MGDYRSNLLIGITDLKNRKVKPLSRDRFIYFSIKNCSSENHRTFRIKKQPTDSNFAPDKLVLELLIGSDNENDYLGIGFINDFEINTWNKFKGTKNNDLSVLVGQLLFGFNGKYSQEVIEKYSITTDGNCFRCGKLLTEPESVESGYGPICRSKLGL